MVSVAIWACQKSVASCLRTLPNARIAIWGAPPGSASYHGWQNKTLSPLKFGGTLRKAFLAVDASVASEITTHLCYNHNLPHHEHFSHDSPDPKALVWAAPGFGSVRRLYGFQMWIPTFLYLPLGWQGMKD